MVLAALMLTACADRIQIPEAPGLAGTREVSITISEAGLPPVDTRSSVTSREDAIRSASVFFYTDGVLVEDLSHGACFTGSGVNHYTCDVVLDIGRSYDILVVANCDVDDPPASLTAALSGLSCTVTDVNAWSTKGLPMAGRTHYYVSPTSSSVEVQISRLVAKVNFTIHTSGVTHGSIRFTSMKVRQMNTGCPFFADGKAVRTVCDGDLASAQELSGVNANPKGYTCSFYVLENLQGDILPGNSNPDLKVPDMVRAAGRDPGLCTYLELSGDYSGSSGQLRGEPLTARLFLGADPCSNFDIVRNNQYNVDLYITDEGCLNTDWKIDGNLQDDRYLRFNPQSSTLDPGSSAGLSLYTNLSYSAGDYSYSVTGDLMYFEVAANANATQFTVSCRQNAPPGAQVQIRAATWDGKLSALYTASVASAPNPAYEIVWQEGGAVLYLAQRGTLYIRDASTGGYPSGTVKITSTTGVADLTASGSGWIVDAVAVGEDVLTVKVDGRKVAEIPLSCVAPVLKFSSDRIFLPIDGSVAECGPYYHKVDGSRLYYTDFVPELYEELLDVQVERSVTPQMCGNSWTPRIGGGNPAVGSRLMGTSNTAFGFFIKMLTVNGVGIGYNYDFSAGEVTLETITGCPNDRDCGVLPATAELYTADPFTGSEHLGQRVSWALARWPELSDRNESFTFSIDDMVLPGNDMDAVSVIYPFSEEGKYEFTHIDRNTIKMTILYNTYAETAMPEHYFALAPAMRNRNSGETYISHNRFSVDFTVNLAVGGIAEDNDAGGCDVSVEWVFPRRDEGRLRFIEQNAVAAWSDAGRWNKGMYERLYVVYGYSPDYIMEMEEPQFSFADLEKAPSTIKPLSGSSYHVPEGYGGGYDLVIWKYGELYPDTNGWLSK